MYTTYMHFTDFFTWHHTNYFLHLFYMYYKKPMIEQHHELFF